MIRWYTLYCCTLILGSPTYAQVHKAIYIQGYSTQNPESKWIRRFLRLQGYTIHTRRRSSSILSLQRSSHSIILHKAHKKQHFRLPKHAQSARLRAKMIVMYIALFVEQHAHTSHLDRKTPDWRPPRPIDNILQKDPTSQKARRKTKKQTTVRRRRARRKRRTSKKYRKKRVLRYAKQRTYRLRRDKRLRSKYIHIQRSRPKRIKRIKVRTNKTQRRPLQVQTISRVSDRIGRTQTDVKIKKRSQTALRLKSTIKRASSPKRLVALHRFKRTPPKTKRSKVKQSNVLRIARIQNVHTRVTPSKKRTLWGDIVRLSLSAGGGLRWSNLGQAWGGGGLSLGLDVYRFTLRSTVYGHAYFLRSQKRFVLFIRPDIWLGWRVPLGQLERSVNLYILAGTSTELFIQEARTKYASQLKWGLVAGIQAHWHWSRHFSMYIRPALHLYPEGALKQQSQLGSLHFEPLIQLGMQLGIQATFR